MAIYGLQKDLRSKDSDMCVIQYSNEWSKGFWSQSVVLEKYWTDKGYKDVDQERGWWILDINFIVTSFSDCSHN